MRSCYKGGYVVGAAHSVPEDPSVVGEEDDSSPIGCSRLMCQRCGARVQQARRLRVAKEPRSVEDMYEVADWKMLKNVKPDERGRLYVCKCAYHVEIVGGQLEAALRVQ